MQTPSEGTLPHLGASGPNGSSGRSLPITVHGRTFDTGSQVFMQEAVLLGGPLREDIVSHKSNIDIVEAVAKDQGGIGFGGLSYAIADVKAVPLAFNEGDKFVAIDSAEADLGFYPLVRRLQLVVNHDPRKNSAGRTRVHSLMYSADWGRRTW